MKLHPEELALSRAHTRDLPFEGLTDDQLKRFESRALQLYEWFEGHPYTHNAIGVLVLCFLFGADYWVLFHLSRWLLPDGLTHSTGSVLLAAVLCGSLHSYVMYSMAIFSVHEAFTHRVLFQRIGPISRFLHRVASHLCRIAGVEPNFYSVHHVAHHEKFGTEEDGELLNFVRPRRYWLTWLPLATLYTDFACHRPPTYTKSRVLTAVVAIAFHLTCGYFLYEAFGLLFPLIAFVVCFPHVGFYLDRARQFTEHNLMPLENRNGARSFGLGFWGMFLGGGPWGTPCHLEHHLVPQVPWYHQLMLHGHLRSLLTPRQREQFLVQPVIGWPKLWLKLLREHGRIERDMRSNGSLKPEY